MNAILSGMHDHSQPIILKHSPATITDIINHARTLENRQSKELQPKSPVHFDDNTTQLARAVHAVTDFTRNLTDLIKGHQTTVFDLQGMSNGGENEHYKPSHLHDYQYNTTKVHSEETDLQAPAIMRIIKEQDTPQFPTPSNNSQAEKDLEPLLKQTIPKPGKKCELHTGR